MAVIYGGVSFEEEEEEEDDDVERLSLLPVSSRCSSAMFISVGDLVMMGEEPSGEGQG